MTALARHTAWAGYAAACAAAAAATWLRSVIAPYVGADFPFIFFLPAVLVAAAVGGLGPGLLCTALSFASAAFFFMDRTAGGTRWAVGDLLGLGSFALIGCSIAICFELMRRWQRALIESRERLLLVGNALPALISLVDREGRYQFVNAAYTEWFGLAQGTFVGKSLPEVLGSAAYATIEPYVRRALSGETVTYRSRIPYAQGGGRDIQATYVPHVVAGEVAGFVALVVDVSESARLAREKEELLLREHEARRAAEHGGERLRFLVENSPYAVAMLDRSLRYEFASRRWLSDFRLNLTNDSIRGRSHYELFPEIPAHWREIHQKCLTGEVASNEAEQFVRADGRVDWIHWEIRPWRDERGDVGGIVIFSEDISERQKILSDLRAAVRVRDEFLSVASHELRTPLTTLDLQLESLERALARDAVSDRDKLRSKVEVALRQVDRLTALVQGLLDVSHIATKRFELELGEVDLVDLTRAVVAKLEREAAAARSPVEVRAGGALITLCDRNRMQQALTSLLENALKFGAGHPVDVALEARGLNVALEVHDRGIGISAADLERIFQRFERAASPDHYGGLGLGLYIAAEIVRAHDGTIEVASSPAEGTTFTIVMPRRAKLRAPEPTLPALEASP